MSSDTTTFLHQLAENMELLLKGQTSGGLATPADADPEQQLALERLAGVYDAYRATLPAATECIENLSEGRLDADCPKDTALGGKLKELQSILRHAAWQFSCLAEGDFSQELEFMGDFSSAFRAMHRALEERQSALQTANTELLESRRFLQAQLNGLPMPIYFKDTKGRLQLVNTAYGRLAGESAENIVGRLEREVFTPSAAKRSDAKDMEAAQAGADGLQYEETLNFSGQNGVFLHHKAPVADVDGRHMGIAGALIDISARNRMEQALAMARDAAEDAARSKSMFLANMSHEIRTPLNGLLGMLQLLETAPMDDDNQEYLAVAKESGHSLLGVINDVLDFSKIEAGKTSVTKTPLAPVLLFDSILDVFRPQAEAKGVALTGKFHSHIPDAIATDKNRLRQILYNLIGNALKFTDSGSVTLSVQPLRSSRTTNNVRLLFSVSDTGPGIPEEAQENIFESFTQLSTKDEHHRKGTGLGLAITRRLVELLGGHIWLDSVPGEGSTFFFTIRAAVVNEEDIAKSVLEHPDTLTDSFKVLLVEDDATGRLVAERFLERLGHRCTTATNGKEALDAVQKERFDLILMDVEMPAMDGIEATRRIRSGEAGEASASLPIVAMTAHAMHGDRERFLEAGMNHYITKPIAYSILAQTLARVEESRED